MADFAWVTHAAGERRGTKKFLNLDKVLDMVRSESGDMTAIFLDASADRAGDTQVGRDRRLVLVVETPEQICKQRL